MNNEEILREALESITDYTNNLTGEDALDMFNIAMKALSDTEPDTGWKECPDCEGRKVYGYSTCMGRIDTDDPCPTCNGTGYLPPKEQDDIVMKAEGFEKGWKAACKWMEDK